MKTLFALMITLLSSSAFAAGTAECGMYNDIAYLESTKSIGAIKVAHVYTEEPATAADHILVFMYNREEMGVKCERITLNADGSGGFGWVDMKTLKSVSYDAKKGRLLQVNVHLPDVEGTGKPETATVKFRVNLLTNKVTIE